MSKSKPINIAEKFSKFSDHWSPKIGAELNGQHVKFAKFQGEFTRHAHEHEDEMFLVINGVLKMEFDDRTEVVNQGEFIVIPKGVYHNPIADEEVEVILFEPATTLNTGDSEDDRKLENLEWI